MIKIRKHTALFTIIPLFAVALTIGYIGDVAAINEGTVDDGAGAHDRINMDVTATTSNIGTVDDGAGAHDRHNMDTGQSVEQFLRDAKATEPEAKTALTSPYFDLVDVQKASANSDNLYKAIFDVWAGDIHVTDLKMLVTSDSETIETYTGSSMNAGDHSITTILIRALDPGSIGAVILGWNDNPGSLNHLGSPYNAQRLSFGSNTVEAKTVDGSYIEIFDLVGMGGDMYKATFTLYAGPEGSPIGRVQKITSDISTYLIPVPRVDANSHDWFSVLIQANDPSTIKAE